MHAASLTVDTCVWPGTPAGEIHLVCGKHIGGEVGLRVMPILLSNLGRPTDVLAGDHGTHQLGVVVQFRSQKLLPKDPNILQTKTADTWARRSPANK